MHGWCDGEKREGNWVVTAAVVVLLLIGCTLLNQQADRDVVSGGSRGAHPKVVLTR